MLTYEERMAEEREEYKQMKRQELVAAMKVGATLMAGVMLVTSVIGAFRSNIITEGNFGIERYFGGTYNEQTFGSGLKLNAFDSIYEVYGKELLIKIEDVRPKDADGIMLKDLDLSIAIKANKENAVPFLLKGGDIVFDKDKDAFILGKDYVTKEAKSVATQSIRKFKSEELIDKQGEVESTFKTDLQTQLDKLYGKNTFTVTDVKLANVQFSDAIEEKIQSIELIRAEEAKAEATKKILETRNKMLNAEVQGLQKIAKDNGVSFDQLMDYQKTKVLMEQKSAPQLTMSVSSPKAPKQ